MRLVVGAVLVLRASPGLWSDDPSFQTTLPSASLAGSGLLLVAGLWTPLAGTLAAILQILQILTVDDGRVVCLLAATIAGALAMLGPGRWSIDARLFGWKRIEVPPRGSRSSVL
jgi:hypothetical protein